MDYVVMMSPSAEVLCVVLGVSIFAATVFSALWFDESEMEWDDFQQKKSVKKVKKLMIILLITFVTLLPVAQSWNMVKRQMIYNALTGDTAAQTIRTFENLLNKIDSFSAGK